MAIDLLDLIAKNSALVGFDPTFSGLTAPEAVQETPENVETGGVNETQIPTENFIGTLGQYAGLLGNVLGAGMSLMSLGAAPTALAAGVAGKGLLTDVFDVLNYDLLGPRSKSEQFIDALFGADLAVKGLPQVQALPEVVEALFGDPSGSDFGMGGIAFGADGIAYSTDPGAYATPEQIAAIAETLFGDTGSGGGWGGPDGWGGLGDIGSGGDFTGADDTGYGGAGGYGSNESEDGDW